MYHDTVTNDPNDPARTDVNVYLHKLTYANGGWTAGPRIQVNDPYATEHESDQFMPSVTVDDNGRIHIIFYDDRNYTDDPNDPENDQQPDDTYLPKFDAFYAYSTNQGQTWVNEKLWFDPPEPALDFTQRIVNPKEYIGICWYDDLVWTAYTGTYSADPYNKGVIWSSRIEWP